MKRNRQSQASVASIARAGMPAWSLLMLLTIVALLGAKPVAAATLDLAWDAVDDARVALYQVHYGQQSGLYDAQVETASTTVTIASLAEGATYYFAVRACTQDAADCSDFSDEISAAVAPDDDPIGSCNQDPLDVDSVTFAAGDYTLASAHSVSTHGRVEIEPNSAVTFNAPTVKLGVGFRVDAGGRFQARNAHVSCTEVTSLASTAQATEALPVAVAATANAAPANSFSARADQLPAWIQDQLSAHGIDLDAMRNMLLDADEQWLVFETDQAVARGDRNGVSDVYRVDLFADRISLVSRNAIGLAGNGPSGHPTTDAWGEQIVFQSTADNLVADDENGVSDIFIRDIALEQTTRLTDADFGSEHPALDASGEALVYDQRDFDGRRQVLAEALWQDATIEVLSLDTDDLGEALDNHHPALSSNARYVAYLEERSTDSGCYVHLYDRDTSAYHRQECPSELSAAAEAAHPVFSADSADVLWHLPTAADPIVTANPLYDSDAS